MNVSETLDRMVERSKVVGPTARLGKRFNCQVCDSVGDAYMVKDEVWVAAGFDKGYACLACLPVRLGRPLHITDFTEALINIPIFTAYNMALNAKKESQ